MAGPLDGGHRGANGPLDIGRVARAVSAVENRQPEAAELLRRAWRRPCTASVVGVTGPPGAGKSTLLDRLALHWAEAGLRLAVLAVDPSSPCTGGALLGDRYRMERAGSHPNVFVRSLSSRGQAGGLGRAVQDVAVLLGSLGFDRIVVETVGSGQSDVDIAQLADCVVVVSVPGLGDDLQAAKAGILEIGDVHAVNKSDTPGAEGVAAQLNATLDRVHPGEAAPAWRPPVLRVSATEGRGIAELARSIDGCLSWQRDTGRDVIRRAGRVRSHLVRLATAQLLEELDALPDLAALVEAVATGQCLPQDAARELVAAMKRKA